MRKVILSFMLIAISNNVYARPKYIPVANGLFSTGQWYFEGTRSAMGGNVMFNFVPALQFSNTFALIPSLETNYRGTRSAEELAGGNTLFQDTWENAISLKAVHGFSDNWSIKERLAVRSKWFRETTDESWTDGLYDYQSATVGAELERKCGKIKTLAVGYDFSLLAFPNYQSLESSQSGENAREFAGTDVLDSKIHLLSVRYKTPFMWKTKATLSGFYNPRFYDEQHVVKLTGLFSSEKREDTRTGINLSLDREFEIPGHGRLFPSLNFGFSQNDSNQNHYDARLTTFIANYYDYNQLSGGINLAYAFGQQKAGAMIVESGFAYSRRNYSDRVIQSESGAYLTDKLYIQESAINLAFSYPLSKNFRARLSSSLGKSKSNNNYEAAYRYNYDNASYQFGVTYEY